MEPILNELSVAPAMGGPQTTDERMRQLVDVLQSLFRVGAARVLRSTRDAVTRELAPALSLSLWLGDRRTLREEKRFLQVLLGKAPFVEELLRGQEADDSALAFSWGNQASPGLGVAHLLDAPAVSIVGTPAFERTEIGISMLCMRDGTEEVHDIAVPQFSTRDHVDGRKTHLRERVFREIRDGSQLWAHRQNLFPRLDFCVSTERSLRELSGNERSFREICRHLYTLSDALDAWSEGPFDPAGLDWSPESKGTLAHPRYGAQRRILCPDGETRIFSAKSKIRSANIRIYFEPISETRRAFVGYVGAHLPTVNYAT
jgi:hypothetical protein